MEAIWQQGINTLVKVFPYDAVDIMRLSQDDLHNPRQFDSVKDLYSNRQHSFPLSVSNSTFVHFLIF
jgi:hypothetical protein